MKNPLSGLFRARDKPRDAVSPAEVFYFGSSVSGKTLNPRNAVQVSTVWITPDDVHRNFPDVPLAIHFSRHHMMPKDQKSARPRFHCLFAIEPTTDVKAYADMKARLNALFPCFVAQALDGARFFFGADDPEVDFFPGTITLNECLERYSPEKDSFSVWAWSIRKRTPSVSDPIPTSPLPNRPLRR